MEFSGASGNRLPNGRSLLSVLATPIIHRDQLDKFRSDVIGINNGLALRPAILAFSPSQVCAAALGLPKPKTKKSKKDTCPQDEDDHDHKDKKKAHKGHGKLWFFEKVLSAALLVVIPLAIAFPNPLFDLILVTAIMPHIHWGIVATVIDYARPIILGETLAMIAYYTCFGISAFIALGLLHLVFKGQGIGNSIQTLWSMGPNK